MFDRAAIRLRGQRAKLNFHIQEYTDATVRRGPHCTDDELMGTAHKLHG